MTHQLHIDIESFSVIDLRKVGVHVYAAHPETEILCVAVQLDDCEPELWVPENARDLLPEIERIRPDLSCLSCGALDRHLVDWIANPV